MRPAIRRAPLALPTFQNGAIVGDKRINDEPVLSDSLAH